MSALNAAPPAGADTGAPLLSVERATKRFGGVAAVQNISFSMAPGEIVGLIGPNGAGKTTLINMITGVAAPTEGTITFDGTRLNRMKPHTIGRMGIARTFQVVRPFSNLSVLENVAVGAMFGAGGARRTAQEATRKAEEVLDFVGLSSRRHDPAESLPVGGRKQLELARALAMEPRLLLLDEVMAGLRGAEVDHAMRLIQEVNARGVTVLVIEHVMKVILGVCQRVVVLDYGKKIAEGPPSAVTRDPAVIEAYLGQKYAARARQRAAAAGGVTAEGEDAAVENV